MAVKKKQNVEAQVEETKVEEVKEEAVADSVEVDVPADTVEENDVQVDTEAFKVDEVNIPEEKEKKVKIRLRVDHHCCIAMERYYFKAGECYNVPANVKSILGKAGLLAPL